MYEISMHDCTILSAGVTGSIVIVLTPLISLLFDQNNY